MGEDAAKPAKHRDGVWLLLAALLVYAACGRFAWHGIDMLELLNRVHMGSGADAHDYYLFYVPLLHVGHALVEPFGGGIYRAALLVSAAGSAFGVACAHVAARELGMSRCSAIAAAMLVATMPAVSYFAVIVEVHGSVLACSGVAWVLMARWASRPSASRAALAGLGLAFAWCAHPAASVLGLAMVPFAMLAPVAASARTRWRGYATALAVLLGCMLLLPPLVRWVGGNLDVAATADKALFFHSVSGRTLFDVTVREWFVPFLPTSLALLAGLGPRRTRARAAAGLLACLPFVLISYLILATDERGAYCAVVAGPAALVVAAMIRDMRLLGAALVVASLASVWQARRIEETPQAADTARAVAAAVGEGRALWLVGDGAGPDGQAWLTRYWHLHVEVLANVLAAPEPQLQQALRDLDVLRSSRAEVGERTIVTSTTIDTLTALAAVHTGARTMLDWLLARRGEALASSGGVTIYALRAP